MFDACDSIDDANFDDKIENDNRQRQFKFDFRKFIYQWYEYEDISFQYVVKNKWIFFNEFLSHVNNIHDLIATIDNCNASIFLTLRIFFGHLTFFFEWKFIYFYSRRAYTMK